MKSITLKKTFLVLLLSLAASCGSDSENTIGDEGNPIDPNFPVNPVVVSGQLSDLRNFIDLGNFPEQMYNNYESYTLYNQVTEVKNRWYGVSYKSFGKYGYRTKELYGHDLVIKHEYGNSYDSIKRELLRIVDRTVYSRKVDNCLWELRLNDSTRYGINVCMSMIANPVSKNIDRANVSKTEYRLL